MSQMIIVVGHLGADPRMQYTPKGIAVTNFSLASNDIVSGEKKTTWFRCASWSASGEACNQYLKKGSQVKVVGRLISSPEGNPNTFTTKDGKTGTNFEIFCTDVEFLSGTNGNGSGEPDVVLDDTPPF